MTQFGIQTQVPIMPYQTMESLVEGRSSAETTASSYATTLSPSSSAEDMEAAAVLVSLPSIQPDHHPSPPMETVSDLSPAFSTASATTSEASVPTCIMTDSSIKAFRARPTSPLSPRHTTSRNASAVMCPIISDHSMDATMETAPSGPWFGGTTSLYLPEDNEALSPLHCFMRLYCVEAFSATDDDVSTPRHGKAHGGKVVLGRVGIRCLHCRHLPPHLQPERAVSYPSTLRNIYHSIETWQRRHSTRCLHVPGWIKKELMGQLKLSRTGAGGRRQYWEDSARRLGMVDTPHGVRFARDPSMEATLPVEAPATPRDERSPTATPSLPLVQEVDKCLVSEFLYLLMQQVETCVFTEQDRAGGRSKVKDCPVGFPGMQCVHCQGKAGYGRYFPSSLDTLALANSDRNIYNHVRKCRRCPTPIQQKLEELSGKQVISKNKRGSRKRFFLRVWQRMHTSESDAGDRQKVVICSRVSV